MSRQSGAAYARALQDRAGGTLSSSDVGAEAYGLASDHDVRRANLDELYRRHAEWLRRAISRRYGAQWVDDLTQETFFRAAAYPHGSVETPRALLMTIARNVARDQFRRSRVRAQYAALPEADELSHSTAPGAVDDDFHVREVIKSLPPKLREVILLSKIGGLTNREIAQRCNLSVRAIDKRLQKAIALMVTRLHD